MYWQSSDVNIEASKRVAMICCGRADLNRMGEEKHRKDKHQHSRPEQRPVSEQ